MHLALEYEHVLAFSAHLTQRRCAVGDSFCIQSLWSPRKHNSAHKARILLGGYDI